MARALKRGVFSVACWPGYKLLLGLLVFFFCLGPALAAGGGKPATTLINVVDTRDMEPGLARWIADLYNGDLWLFGLVVVLVMACQGAVLGLAFDRLIGLLGIKLGKMDHHE